MQIQTIELDGQLLRVAVRRGSDASPPLLLFNGIGANIELVEPFVAALDDVTVIVFDVPWRWRASPVPLIPHRFQDARCPVQTSSWTRLRYAGPLPMPGVSWCGVLAQQFRAPSPQALPQADSRGHVARGDHGARPAVGTVKTLIRAATLYRSDLPAANRGGDIRCAGRHDSALLEQHSRHIQVLRGRFGLASLSNRSLHRVGPACRTCSARSAEERSSCMETTIRSCRSRTQRFSR